MAPPLPAAIILGGETTVTVKGKGVGGRNQELALAAAIELDGHPDIALLTFSTDGVDGPTDAAGVLISGATCTQTHLLGLNAQRIVIRRGDPVVGEVNVHFPRAGFRVVPA